MPRGSGMLLAGASPRPWLEKTRGDALVPRAGRRETHKGDGEQSGQRGLACAEPPGQGGSGGVVHGYLD